MDGTFSGCIRIDARTPGIYSVTLSTVKPISNAAAAGTPPGTISLSPSSGPPGAHLLLSGRLSGSTPSGGAGHADICWDGCPDGLVEQGVAVTWGPDNSFTTQVVVPETAWLEKGAVHPLSPGTYPVGIECLGNSRGCGLMGAEATASFKLVAPPPTRCAGRAACVELRLDPDHGAPGDTVAVSGWAPLAEIIGQPFGYELQISPAGATPGDQVLKSLATEDTVATAPLRVDPPADWSAIDASHQVWITPAASPLFGVDSDNSERFAYCGQSSIEVSANGGTTFTELPSAGIEAALSGAGQTPPAPGSPACVSVALDPVHAGSVYATVTVSVYGGGPPWGMVGVVTADAGAQWSLVPTPPGTSADFFGGFRSSPAGVEAIFNPAPTVGASSTPIVEASTDGGVSWTPSHLACPDSGPCVAFGTAQMGNCNMTASSQSLYYSLDDGLTWVSPSWPASVDACSSPAMAAFADGSLLLVDPGSGYLVLRSIDSGRTWSYLGTPNLQGAPADGGPDNGVVLLPDGALLSASSQGPWYLLKPQASQWCQLTGAPASTADATVLVPPEVIGARLWWLQVSYTTGASQYQPGSRLLSGLDCTG